MLKQQLVQDMKTAMKGGEKARLGVIRLINAAIKQREVDERIELDDEQVLVVLEKMVKQRRDSIEQFENADRQDLADKEKSELDVIQTYLPEPFTDEEVSNIIDEIISTVGAESMKDMGKVMGQLKPRLQGRADMGKVSGIIKSKLTS